VLRVLHRDDLVLAIDKPAGLSTTPGRGREGEAALSHLVREIASDALPVHRLDRDTSGVVLFALGSDAHRALNSAFESRRAEKVYFALVRGDLASERRCEEPLTAGRRGTMRVATPGEGLAARTDVAPLERFGGFTACACRPRTGRTHQVRVHLAALGHPLAIDPRYGESGPLLRRDLDPRAARPAEVVLERTPLHASSLRVPHPSGRGWLLVEAPLPADLAGSVELLRAARRSGSGAT
jgi:tRNA pseudouridine32 synthase/23S rRNA pseudouridine746 synthase